MRTRLLVAALAASVLLSGFQPLPQTVHAQALSPRAKVARLLEESGYAYAKVSDNVWSISFEGKSLAKFNVIASTQEDILVIFVIVAEKKQLRVTPEMMQRLLVLNGNLDRVKIGMDKDGDLFARIDLGVRVLDAEELKVNIEQVAAAANEVYGAVKPFVTGPK